MMMGTVGELKGAEAAVSATKDAGAHDSASEPVRIFALISVS